MIIFESTFPSNYRKEEIKKILDYVTTGKFCQLICVPGAGKATILRLLAHNRSLLRHHLGQKEKPLRFIYLNPLELTSYDEAQITKFLILSLDEDAGQNDPLILTKKFTETVNKLANLGQTLIFLFDHFDEYHYKLPRSFFQILRSAKSVAKYKFAAVFATRRDLHELVDPEIAKEFYDFFVGNTLYLKIYDKVATEFMFSQIEDIFKKKIDQKDKNAIVSLTGGHAKLTKILTEIRLRENIDLNAQTLQNIPIILAALFELWLALTAHEQQVLTLIAHKELKEKDAAFENLIKFDLVSESSAFTIPLLEEFVKTMAPTAPSQKIHYDANTREIKKGESIISDLLSPQEYRLLKFLIANAGRIIERDEIIGAVWPDAKVTEGISDEAIDQMIFRLRKKIEDEPAAPKHITTVKGQGLRFTP